MNIFRLIDLFVFGNRWRPIRLPDKTWGVYHPTKVHFWRGGLTKKDAQRDCWLRNHGETEFCPQCGYTYLIHKHGFFGGIDCP
jgi:hypothetical protein